MSSRAARNEDKKNETSAPPAAEVSEDQARFSQLIADAAGQSKPDAEQQRQPAVSLPPRPTVGRIVIYHSKKGDGIVSPAIVLRTRESTNLDVIERWGDKPDNTLSGVKRPDELVAELPDDETVDLLVHGLGGDYREYAVPFAGATPPADASVGVDAAPGTWSWPPRV